MCEGSGGGGESGERGVGGHSGRRRAAGGRAPLLPEDEDGDEVRPVAQREAEEACGGEMQGEDAA